ncbi:hypothetical protein EHE19_009595 [Ruminiclostridium herbifermentans]|uniref:Transposase n=1 Tax=Ruminiclostridium herbifermentans TaxID=2488810 RepID=A0A4U7JN58_9FIRM|nr:hypothetical protein [Ruminiclostridium herbifermentans]QNU68621.1 hypothetical protein EHE19_009595 [Ruminiclostridium herbifermentans]
MKYYELNSELKKWNDFNIYSIDGSTIQVPNSDENLEIFGTNPNQYKKDGALASVPVLYDVMNDIRIPLVIYHIQNSCIHLMSFSINSQI